VERRRVRGGGREEREREGAETRSAAHGRHGRRVLNARDDLMLIASAEISKAQRNEKSVQHARFFRFFVHGRMICESEKNRKKRSTSASLGARFVA
jgi:hypothetical protein